MAVPNPFPTVVSFICDLLVLSVISVLIGEESNCRETLLKYSRLKDMAQKGLAAEFFFRKCWLSLVYVRHLMSCSTDHRPAQ